MRRLSAWLLIGLLAAGCGSAPSGPTPSASATPSPRSSTDEALISLMYLLEGARDDAPSQLQALVKRAYGQEGKLIRDNDPGYTTIELNDGWTLAFIHRPSNYLEPMSKEDRLAVLNSIRDPEQRNLFESHQAWLSVDVLQRPPGADEEAAYARLGLLMAELAGPDVLAIMHPDSNRFFAFEAKMVEALRRPGYLVELGFRPRP